MRSSNGSYSSMIPIAIQTETIPAKDMRYETAGDWYYDYHDRLQIRVAQLDDRAMEACIAVHEVVEALICASMGVTQEAVDRFDEAHPGGEPGDDITAPYYKAHQIASGIERILAEALGVDWEQYGEKVDNLFEPFHNRSSPLYGKGPKG